jgi:hypothetical protein
LPQKGGVNAVKKSVLGAPFDSLDEWEKYLNYVRQLPDDTINKQVLIESAETFIQRRLGLIPPADDDDFRRAVEELAKAVTENS